MQARIICRPFVSFILVLFLCPNVFTQSDDDSYKAERSQAVALFRENKHLEAVPLFEDLAKRNPEDAGVLEGLGACLIDKSATIADQDFAAKERVRARTLLLKAQQLGDNSNLVQTLLQVTPENGVVTYGDSVPERRCVPGKQHLRSVTFLRPSRTTPRYLNSSLRIIPRLFLSGILISQTEEFDLAGEWYERTVKIDPNRETAYRYHADMLTKNGDAEGARTKAIQAVVAEPYNPITWRGLQQWAKANRVGSRSNAHQCTRWAFVNGRWANQFHC